MNLRDENGILKCHGRLEHAEIEAMLVLLPGDHAFTALATKDATRRWKHVQKQLQHFWKLWNRDYISSLRERHGLNLETPKKLLKSRAIVLIQQAGVSRSRWKLGRLIEGKDGVIRGAVLKVVSNDRIYTVERPLRQPCLLELYAEESGVKKDNFDDENKLLHRSTRDAAAIANVKIKNIGDMSEDQNFV